MNVVQKKSLVKAPVRGRVHGLAHGAIFSEAYPSAPELRKQRRQFEKTSLDEKFKAHEEKTKEMVQQGVVAGITTLMSSLVAAMQNWFDSIKRGPFPIPSMAESNSFNRTPSNNAPPMDNNVPPNIGAGRENSPGNEPHSSLDVSVSCAPGVVPPSTLAELDVR